jgi:CheY-like chemotaxis protein
MDMDSDLHKILVVDDDDIIRGLVSKMLSRLGYEVASADSAEVGLALFEKNKFDLILTDFHMTGMDGIAMAGCIKEKSPSTQVVLMTADNGKATLTGDRDTAIDKALSKPFSIEEMEVAVQGLLEP